MPTAWPAAASKRMKEDIESEAGTCSMEHTVEVEFTETVGRQPPDIDIIDARWKRHRGSKDQDDFDDGDARRDGAQQDRPAVGGARSINIRRDRGADARNDHRERPPLPRWDDTHTPDGRHKAYVKSATPTLAWQSPWAGSMNTSF